MSQFRLPWIVLFLGSLAVIGYTVPGMCQSDPTHLSVVFAGGSKTSVAIDSIDEVLIDLDLLTIRQFGKPDMRIPADLVQKIVFDNGTSSASDRATPESRETQFCVKQTARGVLVQFETDQPGIVQFTILNQAGRVIRELLSSDGVSRSQVTEWDGRTSDGGMSTPGHYAIVGVHDRKRVFEGTIIRGGAR